MRVDPLNSFKPYRGGYNITNNHYWTSLAFTGVYGYVISLGWLVCGMIYGGFVFATFYCCKNQKDQVKMKKDSKYSPTEYSCSDYLLLLPILFTILAIIAFGFVVGGNAKVYGESRKVVGIVMQAADKAVETLNNTTEAMEETRDLLKANINHHVIDDQTVLLEEVEFLSSTTHQLHSASANLGNQTKQHRHFIYNFLKIVYVIVIITVSMEVLMAVALSATAILRLWHVLLWLIVMCWTWTALCWLLFGIYYSIEKFSRDTCAALEDFEANPENNSLSSILHCSEQQAKLLLSMNKRIYTLVNQVNAEMEVKWNPNLGFVCNPFSGPPHFLYIHQHNCPPHSNPLTNLPKVISGLACSGNIGKEEEACKYKEIEGYMRTIQKVVDVYPSVEDLLQCGSVKDAIFEIIRNHCNPITRFLRMVWVAILCSSILMLLSLLACGIILHSKNNQSLLLSH